MDPESIKRSAQSVPRKLFHSATTTTTTTRMLIDISVPGHRNVIRKKPKSS
jgi:hypothetical protein